MQWNIRPNGALTANGNSNMGVQPSNPGSSTQQRQQPASVGRLSEPRSPFCPPARPKDSFGARPPLPGSAPTWTREAQRAIKTLIDFVSVNDLNPYGDPKGTTYQGGSRVPLDAATGKPVSRPAYILANHPGLVLDDALVSRVKDAVRGIGLSPGRESVPPWKNKPEHKNTLYVPVTVASPLPSSADMLTVTAWLPAGARTSPNDADHLYLHHSGGFAGVSSWLGPIAFCAADVVKAGVEVNGETVAVPKNRAFVLDLPCIPSTGYLWRVVSTDRSLGYPRETTFDDPASAGMPGAGGLQRFTWSTQQPWLMPGGEHTVKLEKIRAWEETAVDTFKVTVAITVGAVVGGM